MTFNGDGKIWKFKYFAVLKYNIGTCDDLKCCDSIVALKYSQMHIELHKNHAVQLRIDKDMGKLQKKK